MRNSVWKILVVISVMFLPTSIFPFNSPDEATKKQILEKAYRVHVPFIENKGQVESKEVRFYAKTFWGTIFVEQSGVLTYHLPAGDKKGVVIREAITQKGISAEGCEASPTRVNYFIGKDKNKWRTNIPTYGSISLGEIYKGIELKLKPYGNSVEKLFSVSPGGDPQAIRIRMKGVKGLKVTEEGELEVTTELGPAKFTKPFAYQETGGKKNTVKVAYALYEGNIYGFNVGDYDKSQSLIIDPLLASTFIGGSGADRGNSIALDSAGNVYVTGYTDSSDYPTVPGCYDTSYNGGDNDVFVSKLDGSLSTLLASTFIGGSNPDYGNSIALDSAGNVYVTGHTGSSDYPTVPGCYDIIHNGANDVFVSKLDGSLSTLLASTFIGGSVNDWSNSIAIDSAGNVYVTGRTRSSDYPTVPGCYDTSYDLYDDVVVSKLDSNLTYIMASTFIGGARDDQGNSIALDSAGNVYVTGYTGSYGFPVTPGSHDTGYNDNIDVFVSKLDGTLGSLLAGTFIGGSGADWGNSIAIDSAGNVYVTGRTDSSDYPTVPGCYDTSRNGADDVFVSKLDNSLTTLLAGTFIGGSSWDFGNSIALDSAGNVYVTGYTGSSDYPTPGGHDTSYNGGDYDVFVSKLDGWLDSLLAGTFIGGSGWDFGNSIALDSAGNVYVTGRTDSSDYPTPGGHDTSYNGGDYDVFVSKLESNLSGSPIIDVKANGSDGPITITTADTLTVTVSLYPGAYDGQLARWCIVAYTPSYAGWHHLDYGSRSWETGLDLTHTGPLLYVSSRRVLERSGLSIGEYTFFFHIGLSGGELYSDSVKVYIQ